jgi:ribosome-binding factor A
MIPVRVAMRKSYRKERLNETIRELLSELLLEQIKDPRIGLITITSVEVATDLMTAKVYFSVMGEAADREETRKGLESARSFLRKTIGRELKLRHVPEFRFIYDDTLDRSAKIDETITKIREADEKDGSV